MTILLALIDCGLDSKTEYCKGSLVIYAQVFKILMASMVHLPLSGRCWNYTVWLQIWSFFFDGHSSILDEFLFNCSEMDLYKTFLDKIIMPGKHCTILAPIFTHRFVEIANNCMKSKTNQCSFTCATFTLCERGADACEIFRMLNIWTFRQLAVLLCKMCFDWK